MECIWEQCRKANNKLDEISANNKYISKRCLFAACLGVILIGLGFSEYFIYSSGHGYPGGTCGQFPKDLTSFTATKKIFSQWKWTYEFEEFDGKIEQVCPSSQRDVNVIVGDKLAVRSDGKILSTVSKTYINDCDGKRNMTMRTGGIFDTIINGNKIVVSFELRDNSDKIVAYVDGRHFFNDNIDVKNVDGFVVANMRRNKFSTSWKWIFTISIPNHPGSDPRVLSMIAGRKSFGDDDEKTDICNQYFTQVAWTFLFCGICICMCFSGFLYSSGVCQRVSTKVRTVSAAY